MNEQEILNRLEEILPNNPSITGLKDMIVSIMNYDEETLSPTMTETLIQVIDSMFSAEMSDEMIKNLKQELSDKNITRIDVLTYLANFETDIQMLINDLKPNTNQRTLLNAIFKPMINIFNSVKDQYHKYDITLPMMLEDGAKLPTYAHETDACADIYASKDMVLPAHSLSNMVHTGIHMELPESWVFMIDPRSSIGSKTGLRLSNSVGIIDEDYRGELGVLYDNISDSDYEIKAGDRIAQGWIQPVYRFKPIQVDKLKETERGSGGFGSTGK